MDQGLSDTPNGGTTTEEWLVLNSRIAEEEDDRFIRTVLHFRQDDGRRLGSQPLAPSETASFVKPRSE
jgi:hypothetical protein